MQVNSSVVIAVIAAGVISSLVTSGRNQQPAPEQTAQQQNPSREYVPILVAPRARSRRRDSGAHHNEAVDPSWAGKTSALLKSDLADVAQSSSFELVEAECRTTSCLATLQWPSFGKAQADWRKLLHHGYQANCSREITLPEPADETAPYQATMVLDCEGWRAESQ